MILSPKQKLERDTGASVESKMVEMNQRIRNEKQNQTEDRKTETACRQIEKLMAKMAGDVLLLNKHIETLLKKQREIENMLSAHQEEKLSSTLQNHMANTRTNNIERLRDNHYRFQQKNERLAAAQECET